MQQLKASENISNGFADRSLINDLLARLEADKVQYCHWKSNWRISRWLDGEGDLDLLVKREDIGKFSRILNECGFKRALAQSEKEFPGVVNYYGYDPNAGRFVHIHAHFQLVFGHDLTKNYRLPIEDDFILSAIRSGEIWIASPEMELVLFVVRMVLKYSVSETIVRKLTGKYGGHLRNIRDEIAYLETRIEPQTLKTSLGDYFPMISQELLENCLHVLKSEVSFLRMLRVKWNAEKSLSPHSRTSRPTEMLRRMERRCSSFLRGLVLRKPVRKRFENGGTVIALVGGDGAGKTTCVNEITHWLSQKFTTRSVHLGKPRKSVLTLLVAGVLKIASFMSGKNSVPSASRSSHSNSSENGLLQNVRSLCTARDRFHLYRKIRRLSARGEIIVCDRYPVPQLRLMDGPKIAASETPDVGKIKNVLSRIERSYYRKIIAPDSLFVLRVEPKIAVSRKTTEGIEHVFSRTSELWNFNWTKTHAHLVDANRPLSDVLSDLRLAIWKRL